MAVKLSELLRKDLIFLDVEAHSRDELIKELVRRIVRAEDRIDPDQLLEGLIEREALGGTVVGGGIYLPHARIASAGDELVAFARLNPPLPLDTPDGQPVWLAALSVTDPESPGRHMQLISQLARLLHLQPCLDVLGQSKDRDQIIRWLQDALREKPKKYQLLLAILPDDEAVHDFLNSLAGIGIQGATAITARGMGEILSKGPSLFAGFRELFGAVGSARLVMSAMEESQLEEAIRLFENLKEHHGVTGVAFHLPLGGMIGLDRA